MQEIAVNFGDYFRGWFRAVQAVSRDRMTQAREMDAYLVCPAGTDADLEKTEARRLSEYRVLERNARFSFLEVRIGTGRTHQIRVHFASIRHPIAGDKLYGAPAAQYGRYFLHAASIAFNTPANGQRVTVSAPLPQQLSEWLAATPQSS